MYVLAGTIGSLISFFVLDIDPGEVEYKPSKKEVAENCGMNDCPWNVQNGTFTTDVPRDTVSSVVSNETYVNPSCTLLENT